MYKNNQLFILLILTLSITLISVTDFAFAQLEVITYAGKLDTSGSDNGDALTEAQFSSPRGLVVDSDGNVYVADAFNNDIRIIYTNDTVDTYAGTTGTSGSDNGDASNASFNFPIDLAIDAIGNLYVAERNNNIIRIIYVNKTVATYAGVDKGGGYNDGNASTAQFSSPRGIAIDSNGDLYVTDTLNQLIRVIYTNKTVATYAGKLNDSGSVDGDALNAKFHNPTALAISSNNDLYIADFESNKIRIIYANNKTVDTYAGSTAGENNGNVSNAKFTGPHSIAIAPNKDLYILEYNLHRIRVIYANNDTVDTYAGKRTGDGSTDGVLSNAKFRYPSHVEVAPNGDIYISDSGNYLIRKIADTKPPIITLNGSNTILLEVGDTYSEFGAITDDASNVTIGGDAVDTNTTGNYTVTYDARDTAKNNATQVNRTVIVQNTITLGASWTTRQQIDISSSNIPSTLYNFTVLISMNSPNLNSSAVQSDGNDIRFTASDGSTLLDHEIELFSNNITSGSLVAWVRIPTLSSSDNTTIFIYYNVPDAVELFSTLAWDSDYEIIYHMNQTTFDDNSTLDSTSNNRHGTPTSVGFIPFDSNDLVDAIIGKGLDFDGINAAIGSYIDLPDLDSSLFDPTYTISLWLNFDTLQHNRIYSFLTTNNTDEIAMVQYQTTGDAIFIGNTKTIDITSAITKNKWSYFTLVQNTSSATVYKDGVQIGSNSDNYTAVNVLRDSARLGGFISYSADLYYNGQIDEFRLSSTARSADWIATEYINQNSPNTFYTVSGLEVSRAPAADTTPPVITLLGSNPQFIELHTSYTELGAIVSDDSGERIVPQINSSSVDTNQTGNYTVTYDATDDAGNDATQVNRTVIVQNTITLGASWTTRQQIDISSSNIPSTLYQLYRSNIYKLALTSTPLPFNQMVMILDSLVVTGLVY